MNEHAKRLELDKILAACASHAVLEAGKEKILALEPVRTVGEAKELLDLTEEASLLLFTLGSGKVEEFPACEDSLARARKGLRFPWRNF